MSKPLPPHDRALLAALEAERNPDAEQLASERNRPVPAVPGYRTAARVRGTTTAPSPGPPSYAAAHDDLREWIAREHPTWEAELFTLGDGDAHVVIERPEPGYALALCGESGYPHAAPVIAPPCQVCRSFRPRHA